MVPYSDVEISLFAPALLGVPPDPRDNFKDVEGKITFTRTLLLVQTEELPFE